MIFREKFVAEKVNMEMMRYLEDIVAAYRGKSV
jgi:hypothetical protein